MFRDEFDAAAKAAATKVSLLKTNPAGYFIMSMLAGIFIGFGILLVFTVSGQLDGAPYTRIVMGAFFSVALSLVIIAGCELFTGNNMVLASGVLRKTVTVSDTLKLWAVCWTGNLTGAVLLAVIYNLTGLYTDTALAAMTGASAVKMNLGFVALLTRGALCNTLVCLAVWCGFRAKSDAGKLIMVFWCIVAFFTTGFEHSIANMTLLTLAMINNGGNEAITMGGYWFNLLTVTLGNIIGGVLFVAVPYFIASRDCRGRSGESGI